MKGILAKVVSVLLVMFAFQVTVYGQIIAPNSEFSEQTQYPVFQDADNIYIFCTDEGINIGSLTAETNLGGTKTFEWQKYNNQTAQFDFYFSESIDENQSTIGNLSDGCYRVNITVGDQTETYRAWVMNDWFSAAGEVGESNCEYFELNGSFTTAELKYNDLANNSEILISKNIQVSWKLGNSAISVTNTTRITGPPPEDTDYKYTAYDRFGCQADIDVTYYSIVTEAGFTFEGDNEGAASDTYEAPVNITFTNTSKNGDNDGYEWFFFRDINEIKREAENTEEPIDSIMERAYNSNPIFTYENTGDYMVKLVSKKTSELHICTDTFYLDDYIRVDSSFIEAPNFFTPGSADAANQNFTVMFHSMQDIKISIFNRWGRIVHVWKKGNIRGFENTVIESVWDGKIGGKYASPGVYYYVVEGMGRDGKKRFANGFVHLFRDKN